MMSSRLKSFLSIRPLLVGVSLFGLTWAVTKQMYPPDFGGWQVMSGPDHDHLFLSGLLVAASVALLSGRRRGQIVAAILGGLVLCDALLRDFWLLARSAEVPRFSRRHFSLWWPNLSEGQLLQIVLAALVLACALTLITRSVKNRGAARARS